MGGGQLVEDQRTGSLGHHAVCSFARPPLGWVRRCERAIISPTWMLRRDMQRRRALEEVPGTASMVCAFQYESVRRPPGQEEGTRPGQACGRCRGGEVETSPPIGLRTTNNRRTAGAPEV